MSPLDPSGPPPPPANREVPGWLRATAVLLWGPLGAIVALVLSVGIAALLVGADPGLEASPSIWTESAGEMPNAEATEMSTSLWISSAPSGATVEIRGDSVGVTPAWVRGLPPGRVPVTIRLGALVLDSVVSLRPADDRDLDFRFDPVLVAAAQSEPQPPPSPRTDPSAAPRPISERTAPAAEAPQLPSEGARLSPEAPSRPETPPATARSESRPASPAQGRRQGALEVLVPPGSAILLNGRVVVRNSGARYRTSLPPGWHQVRVIYPSADDEDASVYVGGSVTTMVSFGPDPSAPQAQR